MIKQSTKTPGGPEGISEWLKAIGELAELVAEEQRPQLITLVLVYIAFLVLIPVSNLTDGAKVLMFVATSVGLLWLAFFVLPKQAKDVRTMDNQRKLLEDENDELKTAKENLQEEIKESDRDLLNTIAKAYSYLEIIAGKTANIDKRIEDQELKNQILDLQNYVHEKKREFDSAVARVKSGSQMLATKDQAAASMTTGFLEKLGQQSREVE